MVRELREALDDHQFEVLYQPQVNLNSSAIISYEALLRWRHPLRGLIEPQDFHALRRILWAHHSHRATSSGNDLCPNSVVA